MSTSPRQALAELLADVLDEAAAARPHLFEVVPEVAEFGPGEVERLLGRGHGWAARHAVELGGYVEPGRKRLRFPLHGIRRYQEWLAAETARAEMRGVTS